MGADWAAADSHDSLPDFIDEDMKIEVLGNGKHQVVVEMMSGDQNSVPE